MGSSGWIRYSSHACPQCGGKNRGCMLGGTSGDVYCVKVASDKEANIGFRPGWIHRADSTFTMPQLASPASSKVPAEVLYKANERLLSLLPSLTKTQERDLAANRGILREEAEQLQLKSSPTAESEQLSVLSQLAPYIESLGYQLGDLPFVRATAGGRNGRRYSLAHLHRGGIVIPHRDQNGNLWGFQWRADEPGGGPKYLWAQRKGVGLPKNVTVLKLGETPAVWIVEGYFKAVAVARRHDCTAIALNGNNWKEAAAEALRTLGPNRIVVCPDANAHEEDGVPINVGVARGWQKTRRELRKLAWDFNAEFFEASWESKGGTLSGPDDAILAGVELELRPLSKKPPGAKKAGRKPSLRPSQEGLPPVPVAPRSEIQRVIGDALEEFGRFRRQVKPIVLPIRGEPGIGKSHVLTAFANRYMAEHPDEALVYIGPRRDCILENGRERWMGFWGKTAENPRTGLPVCPEAYRRKAWAEQGYSVGCSCVDCEYKRQAHQLENPGVRYAAGATTIFSRSDLFRSTVFASVRKVVLDDVALQELLVETLTVTKEDVATTLEFCGQNNLFVPPLLQAIDSAMKAHPETSFDATECLKAVQRRAAQRKAVQRAGKDDLRDYLHGKDLTELDPGALPRRFLGDVSRMLREQTGRAERTERGDLIILCRRPLPAWLAYKDIVISDAGLNSDLLKLVFPDHHILPMVDIKAEWPSQAKVTWCPGRSYSKRSLSYEATFEHLSQSVADILASHPGASSVGFIGLKDVVDCKRAEELRDLGVSEFLYFGGQRSSNKLENVDVAIIAGSRYADEKLALLYAKVLNPEVSDAKAVKKRLVKVQKTGKVLEWEREEFVEPLVQALVDQVSDEEIRQAIYRARPLSLDPGQHLQGDLFEVFQGRSSVHIYVLGNTLPDHFTVWDIEGDAMDRTSAQAKRDEVMLARVCQAMRDHGIHIGRNTLKSLGVPLDSKWVRPLVDQARKLVAEEARMATVMTAVRDVGMVATTCQVVQSSLLAQARSIVEEKAKELGHRTDRSLIEEACSAVHLSFLARTAVDVEEAIDRIDVTPAAWPREYTGSIYREVRWGLRAMRRSPQVRAQPSG